MLESAARYVAREAVNAPAAAPPTVRATLNVLLVDDDASIRASYGRALERGGFKVTITDSADAALAACRSGRFDAVLSDLRMPQRDGIELLSELQKISEAPSLVLMTGSPALESAVTAMEHGAVRYLRKPVGLDALWGAVEAAAVRTQEVRGARRAAAEERQAAARRETLQREFEMALSGLYMAVQPITADTGRVVAYESLLRTSATGALTSPPAIIDAAEQLGELRTLSSALRAAVVDAALRLPKDVDLFVNLHPDELQDETLFDPSTPFSKLAPRIVLEITEHAAADEEELLEKTGRLRAMGFRLAVDDFGAGASGLLRIAELKPAFVKLDRMLVRNLDRNPRRRELVARTVELCRGLGAVPLAEGIETVLEWEASRSAGCELFQGYYLGRPARPA